MNQIKAPILFLVFNRPEQTARVFESIRAVRPSRLFVAGDGHRPDRAEEEKLVRQTRQIATAIDWPCEVTTLFRESNLGCGRAVSGAISWFFEHVTEGIILEDDCLPHPDFYPYCETLLSRYRDEPKVATIAGTHFLPPELPHQQSHYVSKYFQMWGWATWRRTWQTYDLRLTQLNDAGWFSLLDRIHHNPVEAGYWREIYLSLKPGVIDTWDFQMFFSNWHAGGNHVMPGQNLISNIGYGADATHTNFDSPMANLPTAPLTLTDTPIPLEPNVAVDGLIFYLRFLESMKQTWWVEQVLSPEGKLGPLRIELALKERMIRELEREVIDKRLKLRAATKALALATAAQTV
jgi:hypothetical protein